MRKQEFILGIDGLRAIAALLVVFYHFHIYAGSPQFENSFVVRAGWIGVDIFFVISGFVLFLPFLKAKMQGEKYSISSYYKRRFLRILPAYYFNIFVLVSFVSVNFWMTGKLFPHFLGHLTFTEGFVRERANINGVFWTLWIEMQFYLILPLFARLFLGKRWWISALSVFALVTVYKWTGITLTEGLEPTHKLKQFYISTQLPGVLQEFVAGMVVAIVYLRCRETEAWNRYRSALSGGVVAGFLMLLAGMWFVTDYGPTNYWHGQGVFGYIPLLTLNTWLGLGAALVVIGICSQVDWIKKVFANRIMTFIGVISYGIYLWHYPLGKYIAAQLKLDAGFKFLVLCQLGIVLSLVWGYFSYRFVELPFLKKKNQVAVIPQQPVVTDIQTKGA